MTTTTTSLPPLLRTHLLAAVPLKIVELQNATPEQFQHHATRRDLWEQIHREADQMTKYNRPDVYDNSPETQARRRAQLLDAFYPPQRRKKAA
jgi:hypothetical protein